MPVALPAGVKVSVSGNKLLVEGPKGKLSQDFADEVGFKVEAAAVIVSRKGETKQAKSYHGLYRNLLNNMVLGVSAGFTRSLVVTGVGYRAEVKGNIMTLNLGYSTDIVVMVPEGITATVEQNTKITLSGIDRQKVGQFAAEVRKLRLPEPYKGKGIRYDNETIRRKVGKSGVK